MTDFNIADLLESYTCFDYETYDPYISRGMGAGWVYKICYPDICDAFTVGVGVQSSKGSLRYLPLEKGEIFFNIRETDILVGQNLQYDLGWYLADRWSNPKDAIKHLRSLYKRGVILIDTKILARLADEFMMSYSLANLTKVYRVKQKSTKILADAVFDMGLYTKIKSTEKRNFINRPKDDKVLLKMAYTNMHNLPVEVVKEYCLDDIVGTSELYVKLIHKLLEEYSEEDLLKLIKTYSTLQYAIMEMRINGMTIDNDKLRKNHHELCKLLDESQEQLNELSGQHCVINVSATTSLLTAFLHCDYKENDIPKTAKGNPSITQDWLQDQDTDIAKLVLRIRKLKKIISSFFENLMSIQDHLQLTNSKYGRVHGEFNIFGAHTGRFSSSNPNLQQVPKRDPEFAELCRGIFVAEEGRKLCASDYSNQEQRIQVHFGTLLNTTGASVVCEEWNEKPTTDFHAKVASMIGALCETECMKCAHCKKGRRDTKSINLGKSYGMGEAKLCHSLGLPTILRFCKYRRKDCEFAGPEGKLIIDKYNALFPFIKEATDICSSVMEERGFIKSLMGRHVHEEKFIKYGRIKKSSRKAFSQLIQGSASDQLVLFIVNYYDYICHNPELLIRLIAIVHDETVYTVPSDKIDESRQKMESLMTNAIKLEVPMLVDTHVGSSWHENK